MLYFLFHTRFTGQGVDINWDASPMSYFTVNSSLVTFLSSIRTFKVITLV